MLVPRSNEPTQLWLHAEHFEVIAGDRVAVHAFRRVTPAQSRLTVSVETRDIAEDGVPPPIVFKRRIRRSE